MSSRDLRRILVKEEVREAIESEGKVLHDGKPGYTGRGVASSAVCALKRHFKAKGAIGLDEFYIQFENGQCFRFEVAEVEPVVCG